MIVSDTSIKRPVLTIVGALIIILLGALSFRRLPVREYPDTDVPTVSVTTVYRGASAEVVESRITEPLEEQLSAIDGIRILKSSSAEEASRITIEFNLDRDPDEAANDVRDRVSRARDRLPDEVNEPIIAKEEADANPVLWLTFTSDRFSRTELTDLVDRIAKQRVQTVPGVGTIFIGGERRYAMRLWLDPDKLASYQLTAGDVELALSNQNVDVPGGRIESFARDTGLFAIGLAVVQKLSLPRTSAYRPAMRTEASTSPWTRGELTSPLTQAARPIRPLAYRASSSWSMRGL